MSKFPSHPELQRPPFRGEKHAPLRTTKGFKRGNYLGPGTVLESRLRRGDQPINFSDRIAKAHDIRYGLAKNVSDVRKADRKMISTLSRGQDEALDYPINLLIGKKGIQAKVGLENLGVSRTGFATFGSVRPGNRALYKRELATLEKQGFGTKGRNPWLAHVKRFRTKHPEMSYKEALSAARPSYNPRK